MRGDLNAISMKIAEMETKIDRVSSRPLPKYGRGELEGGWR
jgi:hypothetical protein